jgi:hypothetical protein
MRAEPETGAPRMGERGASKFREHAGAGRGGHLRRRGVAATRGCETAVAPATLGA